MVDELSQLCPVQFIEGINEGAEYNTQNFIDLQMYPTVAIEYTPKSTYCLAKLEILIAYGLAIVGREYNVTLYSDYKDEPSDIILGEGKLVTEVTKELAQRRIIFIANWHKVDLNPVVVISAKKYWVTINSEGEPLNLVTAVNGDVTNMMIRKSGKWRPDELFSGWQCMLRFYGRVMPTGR